jgi:hypothetical protein
MGPRIRASEGDNYYSDVGQGARRGPAFALPSVGRGAGRKKNRQRLRLSSVPQTNPTACGARDGVGRKRGCAKCFDINSNNEDEENVVHQPRRFFRSSDIFGAFGGTLNLSVVPSEEVLPVSLIRILANPRIRTSDVVRSVCRHKLFVERTPRPWRTCGPARRAPSTQRIAQKQGPAPPSQRTPFLLRATPCLSAASSVACASRGWHGTCAPSVERGRRKRVPPWKRRRGGGCLIHV